MSKRSRRRPGGRSDRHPRLEWIGGLVPAPFTAEDVDGGLCMVLWMERPSGQIVGHAVEDERAGDAHVAEVLRESLRNPMAGPRRKPDRIRVASETLGRRIRQTLGGRIQVVVAPTPELDALIATMAEDLRAGRGIGAHSANSGLGTNGGGSAQPATANGLPNSYLGPGRTPELLSRFFGAAALLSRVAPWRYLQEDPPFRIDAAEFGLRGGCLILFGAMGETFGLMLFPSRDAYDEFSRTGGGSAGSGPRPLCVNYADRHELPPPMRAEVRQHGWEVDEDGAGFPIVHGLSAQMRPCAVSGADIALLASVIPSVVEFFIEHADQLIEDPWASPTSAVGPMFGVDVRVTYPYDAFDMFDWPPDEPCPCGSEQTYAQCCALTAAPRQEMGPPGSPRAVFYELEAHFVPQIARLMNEQHASKGDPAAGVFVSPMRAISLAHCWVIHHAEIDDLSPREHFRQAEPGKLTDEQREWYEAQADGWLSVWRVLAAGEADGTKSAATTPQHIDSGPRSVDASDEAHATAPGATDGELLLADELSGEVLRVADEELAQDVAPGDWLLARVLYFRGEPIVHGYHPALLDADLVNPVVARTRKYLRRKSPIPRERLRSLAFTKYLIRRWEEAAGER